MPENPSKEQLEEVGLVETTYEPRPQIDYTQNAVLADSPTFKDGRWIVGWTIEGASQPQIEERNDQEKKKIRQFRNEKLAECDWTQLPDAPVDTAAWATYRQELRDLTAQEGFPWEVQWPEAP